MRVLHVVPHLPKASGVTTFVVELSDALQELGQSQVVAVHNQVVFDVADSRVGVTRITTETAVYGIRQGKYDIVHMHGIWPPFMHTLAKVSEKRSIPIVWSLHGMLAPWAMRFKRWKKLPVWLLWQKCDLGRAAVLHATTEAEVGWVRAYGLRNRVEVIPLGTRLPQETSLHNEMDGSREKILLFVGRINPVKALDNLLKAWGLVRSYQETAAWHLRIVGTDEGGYRQSLELLSGSLHLEDSVTFAGPKYDEQLEEEYRRAYGLILPSHTENFGGVVIDALARGVPVITSNKTPWKEIVHNDCGWWVDNAPQKLAEAIKDLMSLSYDKRHMMGEKGRNFVAKQYTWQSVARMMKGVYASLLPPKAIFVS